jgi:multidrug resistance efflux pump
MSERQKYVDTIKAKIDEWSNNINDVEKQADKASADLNEEYKEQIVILKKQRNEALVKLKEVQNTTDSAWLEVKKGSEAAWGNISHAFGSAKDKLFDKTGSK